MVLQWEEWGYPSLGMMGYPPRPRQPDGEPHGCEQTENISFHHPSNAGGKNDKLLPCTRYERRQCVCPQGGGYPASLPLPPNQVSRSALLLSLAGKGESGVPSFLRYVYPGCLLPPPSGYPSTPPSLNPRHD